MSEQPKQVTTDFWIATAEEDDRCFALMCDKTDNPLIVFDFPTGGPGLSDDNLPPIVNAAVNTFLSLLEAETKEKGVKCELKRIDLTDG